MQSKSQTKIILSYFVCWVLGVQGFPRDVERLVMDALLQE